jgi:predicted PurR-regulated permease PerM
LHHFSNHFIFVMPVHVSRPYTFDRVVRLIIGLVILLSIFFIVDYLRNVLLPFLLGWLVAYMINPLVNFFQFKLKFHYRALAIFCAFATLAGIVFGLVLLLIDPVSEEITKAGQLFSQYLVNSKTHQLQLAFLPIEWQHYINDNFSYSEFRRLMNSSSVQEALRKIQPHFMSFLSGTLQFVLSLFVVFVILIYVIFILLDYEKITNSWRTAIPPKYRTFCEGLVDDLMWGMNRYFRGQAMVAGLVGIMCAVGFSIIGLPMAIVMGLFIGLLNMVPYLQWFGYIPVTGLMWIRSMETGQSFPMLFLALAIVVVIVQIIQDLFLVPKIMGKMTGLNPALILLSLSIWGALLGIVGMIIALPFTTLIISYYKRYVLNDESNVEPGTEETPPTL